MATFTIGDYEYTTLNNVNVSAKVINLTKTSYSNIPNTVTYNKITYTVTDLSDCFKGCENLTAAPTIPNSVTSMTGCFWGCTNLITAPTIPNSVTGMYYCFRGCTSLTTAPTIPNGVTSINYCFWGCTSLTTAPTIPNGVISMAACFWYCTSLTTAPTIPNSVTDMNSCFRGCENLTTAPIIPNGVTKMNYCFCSCENLAAAPTIPNSVINLTHCFDSCTSLTTAPTIPDSVIDMSGCFKECINLTTAPTIPNSVTGMDYCFWGCTSLTTTPVIPNSVKYMENTFQNCTSLAAMLPIGSGVIRMNYCFYGCTSLNSVANIPNSVTQIDSCFSGCTSLTAAPQIGNSVTDMSYCFYNCTSLTNEIHTVYTIPSSVTIMDGCFRNCSSLTGNIVINATVSNNYSYCFSGTEKGIWLTGSSPSRQDLANTATNNNVYVDSIPLSYSLIAERVSSDGGTTPDSTGAYAHIQQTINWSAFTENNIDYIVLADNSTTSSVTWYTDAQKTSSITLPDWHPSANVTIHSWINIDDHTHNLSVVVSDEYSTGSTISFVIPQAFRTIDFKAGGKEIAMGMPADDTESYIETNHPYGLFKCGMDSMFRDKAGAIRMLFDFIYPVGSYYETSLSSGIPSGGSTPTATDLANLGITWFNPNYAWGGQWKLETEGHVHVSAGTGYSITHADDTSGGGTTVGTRDGGEDQITYTPTGSNTAVTLTGAQSGVQAHAHPASASGGKVGSHAHEPSNTDYQFMACEGTSSAALGRYKIKQGTGSQTEHYFVSSATSVARYNVTESVAPSFTQPTITVNNATAKDATKSHNHTFTGTQVQLDNMQPYIVVNRWHRIG